MESKMERDKSRTSKNVANMWFGTRTHWSRRNGGAVSYLII